MGEKCPCCGWRDGMKTPYTVNTDTNMIFHNGEAVKVPPLEAKLAAACALTYPHPIHTERLFFYLWGDEMCERSCEESIKVIKHRLRKAIKKLGLSLVSHYGSGTSLVPA
jgi:DNA-binding response OmpR family regulator